MHISLIQVHIVQILGSGSSLYEGGHLEGLGRGGPCSLHVYAHVLRQVVDVGLQGLKNIKIATI